MLSVKSKRYKAGREMSRKLVSLIQDNPRLPANHKRVLIAWCAFANNDGTNIFPSKQKVGQKAGIHRATVYRCTEHLLKAGLMVQAKSHVCRNAVCNKGGTHYSGHQGQYTVVYQIQLDALQIDETYLSLKQSNLSVANQQKVSVAKRDATRALKATPASAAQSEDSSALTGGLSFSQSVSLKRPAVAHESEDHETLKPVGGVVASQTLPELPQPDLDLKTATLVCGLGESQILPAFLGLPYIYAQHEPELRRMAAVLRERQRTVHWLESMVKWVKKAETREPKHWAKCLQTGTTAMGKLATFMETGAICEQFDSHIATTQDMKALQYGSTYLPDPPVVDTPAEEPPAVEKFNVDYWDESKNDVAEYNSLAKWFRENCKLDEWNISADEMNALGVEVKHRVAVFRYLSDEGLAVTKNGFIKLLLESAGKIAVGAVLHAAR